MKKALSRKNLWEKTPLLLKSSLGRGIGLIPQKWLLGKSFRQNCKFVNDSQWWPAERARKYQLYKLREILNLAYEKTKFYRHSFDSVGFHPDNFHSLKDMRHLPTIDKQVVIDNLLDMCTKSINSKDVDYGSTGGTSGTPLFFYLNANRSSVEYAYLTTSWKRIGYDLGMQMAVLRGRIVKTDRKGLYHEYDPILRHHYYSNFHMSDENIARYLEHIATIGPCFLHVYPSSISALTHFILREGTHVPKNIKGIIAESEVVYANQQQMDQKVFSCNYLPCYGHSEKLVLASGCEKSYAYHVWPTYGYFELLDNDGNPVITPGQQGEIVGTGFINTVMPFIRYRTGDLATYVSDHCKECGREHIIISNIQGRWPQGGLIAVDGSIVSMTALNVHDDTFKNVRDYQFHQSIPGKATLCIVPNIPIGEKEQRRIVANMNKRLQNQVTLDIEIRTELVKTSRGKQPRVIQKCTVTK
jgi:phenylacetate-CoA ligase